MEHIALVTFVVDDYDRGIDFFTRVLGFVVVEDVPQDGEKRWVVVGPADGRGTALLLARAVDDRQRASIGNQTGGRVGFFLATDEFDVTYGRMLAAGAVFLEAPRNEPYGSVVVFQDPWGNRWDLLERRT